MKYIFKTIIFIALLSFISCDQKIEDINMDPNNSLSANESRVLSNVIGNVGYLVDADWNARSFLWAQYYTWGPGVSIGNAERFVAQPNDHNSGWSRAYASCLVDLKFLEKSESKAYSGVSKVLQAYIFQGLVDHFGNVPFSEAVSGEISEGSVFTPSYDDAATIYGSLVTILDNALVDFRTADGDIGANDFVFGGDISSWIKFANSLKLRILMRTSEVSPNAEAIRSLVAQGNFISSATDVAAIPFSGVTGSQNPMYARFEWGVGDFYFASNATINILNDLADPRIEAFYSRATTGTFSGNFIGINQGAIENHFSAKKTDYSGSSPIAYDAANDVILMSDWEVWLLRAEAAARYGTADDDATAMANAVAANFAYLGIADAAAYVTSLDYSSVVDIDTKINMIAVQKWISMNGTQEDESWIETRRFDRPGNRIFTEGIFQTPPLSVLDAGVFPASWLYPATERSLNPNAPAQREITDRLFWDN